MSASAPRDSTELPPTGSNLTPTAIPLSTSRKRPHDASAQVESVSSPPPSTPSPVQDSGKDALPAASQAPHHAAPSTGIGPAIQNKAEKHFSSQAERYNRAGKEVSNLIEYVDGKIVSWERD